VHGAPASNDYPTLISLIIVNPHRHSQLALCDKSDEKSSVCYALSFFLVRAHLEINTSTLAIAKCATKLKRARPRPFIKLARVSGDVAIDFPKTFRDERVRGSKIDASTDPRSEIGENIRIDAIKFPRALHTLRSLRKIYTRACTWKRQRTRRENRIPPFLGTEIKLLEGRRMVATSIDGRIIKLSRSTTLSERDNNLESVFGNCDPSIGRTLG
jgi:hypothetical protein